MMEQDQLSRRNRSGNPTSHRDRRVPISLRRRESLQPSPIVLIQVLRVMDQYIRILRELHQTLIRADVAFGIRGIHDRLTAPRDAIDEDSARMRIRFMNADDNRIFANA